MKKKELNLGLKILILPFYLIKYIYLAVYYLFYFFFTIIFKTLTAGFSFLFGPAHKVMTGHDYEYFVADYLQSHGFRNVQVTKGSGDFGVDILADKYKIRYAIQCKYYARPVGNAAIQEAVAGKAYYGCDSAMVITNSTFTQAARELADVNDVQLMENIFPTRFFGTKIVPFEEQMQDTDKSLNSQNDKNNINSQNYFVEIDLLRNEWLFQVEKEFIAIHLWTTGSNPQQNSIIKISAIRYIQGKEHDKFITVVAPESPIPKALLKQYHLCKKDLHQAPKLETVLPKFLDYLGDSILIGFKFSHSLNFLESYAAAYHKNKIFHYVDLVSIMENIFPSLTDYSLETILLKIGLAQEKPNLPHSPCDLYAKIVSTIINGLNCL